MIAQNYYFYAFQKNLPSVPAAFVTPREIRSNLMLLTWGKIKSIIFFWWRKKYKNRKSYFCNMNIMNEPCSQHNHKNSFRAFERESNKQDRRTHFWQMLMNLCWDHLMEDLFATNTFSSVWMKKMRCCLWLGRRVWVDRKTSNTRKQFAVGRNTLRCLIKNSVLAMLKQWTLIDLLNKNVFFSWKCCLYSSGAKKCLILDYFLSIFNCNTVDVF